MPKTMKLTDVGSTDSTVARYIEDPLWIMQQKFDGTRVMMTWDPATGVMHWSNDGEKNLTHAAAKLKVPALEAILRSTVEAYADRHLDSKLSLDGELLIRTGEFIVWDLLVEEPTKTWEERYTKLINFMQLLSVHQGDQQLVKVSPTADTPEEKQHMWDRINETNVEGAVSKHRHSLYVPGIRTKEWVKHKLVKTADLVVTDTRRVFKPNSKVVKEGSAALAVADSGLFTPLVSASLIGKDLTIEPGDVVEVAYLYREPGGGLVQPRIIRKRWDAKSGTGDKLPADCGYDQFPEYSREVVALQLEENAV
jgi:bifunctional non-homologous end joining protein LigD